MSQSPATMRAMIVAEPGGPGALQPADLPVPQPGPGQVRLRVAYVGMNPLDAMLRRERLPWLPVPYPFTPGLEHSGVVDAVGDGVDADLVGKRVLSRLGLGGYAEYSIIAAAGLVELPPEMPLKVGAAFRGCTSTAWYALHASARVQPGETVLIHSAAGAVGAMAMQIARDAGARVCGLAGGPEKVAYAADLLASDEGVVIDYLKPDWVDHARAFAGEGGFDVILDGNGGPTSDINRTLVGVLGRIVHIGSTSGTPASSVPPAMMISKSFSEGGIDLRSVENKLGGTAEPLIIDAVVRGTWRVPISEVVPLADVAALHARLESRQIKGRAVIEVGGEDV